MAGIGVNVAIAVALRLCAAGWYGMPEPILYIAVAFSFLLTAVSTVFLSSSGRQLLAVVAVLIYAYIFLVGLGFAMAIPPFNQTAPGDSKLRHRVVQSLAVSLRCRTAGSGEADAPNGIERKQNQIPHFRVRIPCQNRPHDDSC